jgi:hypothetical protein
MEEASDGSFPRKQLVLKGAPGDKGESAPAADRHARFHVSSLPGARNLRSSQ